MSNGCEKNAPLARTMGRKRKARETKADQIPATFRPRFWMEADQRFAVVKELRARVERLQADCGADSYAKQLLCERAVFMLAVLETKEINAIESGAFDSGSYVCAVNGLLGILKALGLKKVVKAASLSDYIAEKEGGKAGAAS